jgi:hypothetical protein
MNVLGSGSAKSDAYFSLISEKGKLVNVGNTRPRHILNPSLSYRSPLLAVIIIIIIQLFEGAEFT